MHQYEQRHLRAREAKAHNIFPRSRKGDEGETNENVNEARKPKNLVKVKRVFVREESTTEGRKNLHSVDVAACDRAEVNTLCC